MKRIFALSVLLLWARDASAETIIWEAFGEVSWIGYTQFGGNSTPPPGWTHLGPPAGTPYSINVSFDPDARMQTPTSPAGAPCSTAAAQGTMALGGFNYALSGNIFTNALFAPMNCYVGDIQPLGSIDFFLFMTALDPDPWELEGTHYLELKYFDLLHQNGTFPTEPTMDRSGSLWFHSEPFFNFSGSFTPRLAAVEEATPVPEPGTMTLFGIGLALAARRRSRR
ncbi:MAG TPA: PEP-CTERM sorting domain-containing protein [Vicinamibacterales bacterium]|nr:PEP-CTERM sorting domain-containing protein [Vicinamibacterales bacterium]